MPDRFLAFFQLGQHPYLSLAEIYHGLHRFSPKLAFAGEETALIELAQPPNQAMLDQLGGSIKLGEVVGRCYRDESLAELIADYLATLPEQGKLSFGLNTYEQTDADLTELAHEVKQLLKPSRSSRYLLPGDGETTLSSGQITQHGLLQEGGIDLSLLSIGKEVVLIRTTAIQDLAAYVRRDEGRPHRDDSRGMMPIKLSQMLINLAHLTELEGTPVLLDPFCGLGSIPQEALALGAYVIGSDLDPNAIDQAQRNLDWFWLHGQKHKPTSELPAQLLTYDATLLAQVLMPESLDAVVSEGYLGRLFTTHPDETLITREFDQLAKLYTKTLRTLHPLLKADRRLVITLPYYRQSERSLLPFLLDEIRRLGYHWEVWMDQGWEDKLFTLPFPTQTERGTYIYDRPDQVVGREILFLKK